jgi:hypothetical protein
MMIVKAFVKGLSNNERKKTKMIARWNLRVFELGQIVFGSK